MKGLFFLSGQNGLPLSGLVDSATTYLSEKGKKVVSLVPVGTGTDALYSLEQVQQFFSEGKINIFIENIIQEYKKVAAQSDFVIVCGVNASSGDAITDFYINRLLAQHLCLPVVLVVSEKGQAADTLTSILNQSCVDVLGVLQDEQDLARFIEKTLSTDIAKISTKMFEANLAIQAGSAKQRIVLPEGECDRVLKAAAEVSRQKVADLIILGEPEKVNARAKELGISLDNVRLIDYEHADNFEDYAQTLCELRKAKGMTIEEARELMKDGAYYGTMMVYKGDADGMVSGAEHTTANTIRPALQFVKTKPGISVVSGAFLMCYNGQLSVFADCAVTPNPTSEQLSEIAVTTAETARLFGLDPKVAFLSYGTGDSGKGPSVDIVKEAVRMVKEKNVDFKLEGPIQFDAAVDPSVAKTKLPNSEVAGHANVFIFPDLNTGNCCYKAVQRALGDECLAVGPVLQGLNKPVNDLSRGATVQDIVNTIAFTAIQAQNK